MVCLIREGTHRYTTFVRGIRIDVTPEVFSEVMSVALVPNFECPYLLGAEGMPTPIEVAFSLYGTPTEWNSMGYLIQDLPAPQYFDFHLVLVGSIFPTSQKTKIYLWTARIFYKIVCGKRVDL